jgi:hypothetical protein
MEKYYVYCFLDPRKPGQYVWEDLHFEFEPFYIGKGSGSRLRAHFYPSNLKIKNTKNNKIKSIISKNKYPIIRIIEENLNEQQAYDIEESLVVKIGRSNIKSGPLCNLTDGGKGAINLKIPKKRKPTYQFSLDGVLLKRYESLSEAAQINNLHLSDISKCCRNQAKTHGGFYWSFKDTNNIFTRNKKNRKILHYDYDGNQINEYESITHAANSNGIKFSTVSRICKGEILQYRGTYFRYYDQDFELRGKKIRYREVLKITNEGIVEFKSVKEASIKLNISTKSVISRCKNKNLFDDLYLIYKDDYSNGIRKDFQKKGNGEKRIKRISIDNSDIVEYESILKACAEEKISRSYLSRLLKNKKLYKNNLFTYC